MIPVRLALIGAIAVSAGGGGLAQNLRSPTFDQGNRYEGLVGLPISGAPGPVLELISFTGSFPTFTGAVDLQVRFFVPSTPKPPIRIVAQELTHDLFYRMESKAASWQPNSWATFGPWPTAAVIVPQKVRTSNLGVIVRLDDEPEGRARVAPAFVHQGTAPGDVTRYRWQFRPLRATLSAVEYVCERFGDTGTTSVLKNRVNVERPAGAPFRIDLDVATWSDGAYRLTVVGHVKNDSSVKITRQYDFEHRRATQ